MEKRLQLSLDRWDPLIQISPHFMLRHDLGLKDLVHLIAAGHLFDLDDGVQGGIGRVRIIFNAYFLNHRSNLSDLSFLLFFIFLLILL